MWASIGMSSAFRRHWHLRSLPAWLSLSRGMLRTWQALQPCQACAHSAQIKLRLNSQQRDLAKWAQASQRFLSSQQGLKNPAQWQHQEQIFSAIRP